MNQKSSIWQTTELGRKTNKQKKPSMALRGQNKWKSFPLFLPFQPHTGHSPRQEVKFKASQMQQCWILNTLHQARDQTSNTTETSWITNPLHQELLNENLMVNKAKILPGQTPLMTNEKTETQRGKSCSRLQNKASVEAKLDSTIASPKRDLSWS